MLRRESGSDGAVSALARMLHDEAAVKQVGCTLPMHLFRASDPRFAAGRVLAAAALPVGGADGALREWARSDAALSTAHSAHLRALLSRGDPGAAHCLTSITWLHLA
jgi:hypothetical protein